MADDDVLYGQVADELSKGQIDRVMWTKAIANSGGAEEATKSLYIRFRVEQLREQLLKEFSRRHDEIQALQKDIRQGRDVQCPHCGHQGRAIAKPRGDAGLCIALYFLFILPGIIYTLMNAGFRYTCEKCTAALGEDNFKII